MEVAISSMPKNVEQFIMLFDASKLIPIHTSKFSIIMPFEETELN
jgi:hypothetical protein